MCPRSCSIETLPNFMETWQRVDTGATHCLYLEGKTEAQIEKRDQLTVALIGRAFDLDAAQDRPGDIPLEIIRRFHARGLHAALEYIAYLAGRFVVFLLEGNSVHVVPDCHATYSIYTGNLGDAPIFSSHWFLAAQVLGIEPSEKIREFMNSPDYVSPGGKYYPGTWTPYEGIRCVFPNCYGKWTSSGTFEHRRFYPFEPLPKLSVAEASRRFSVLLGLSMRRIADSNSLISLTGGLDSLTSLASLDHSCPPGFSSFTYIRSQSPDANQIDDVVVANRVSNAIDLLHRVIPVHPVDFGSDFHRIYQKSFRDGARYPALARSYYECLPRDRTVIISTCAETGTVFYRHRDGSPLRPELLAGKFAQSKISSDIRLRECMEEYIDYTDFTESRLLNFEWEDIFYWEHRNAKWASLWYGEVDLSGFAIVPYNHRGLIEAMLAVPRVSRERKEIQKIALDMFGMGWVL